MIDEALCQRTPVHHPQAHIMIADTESELRFRHPVRLEYGH
jgi:hypothetical protein